MKTKLPDVLAPLMKQDHWVIWRRKDDKKIPHDAGHPAAKAKTNDPDTWSRFTDARRAARNADGLGFMIKGSGIAAIDLDDCRNPKTGKLAPWAQTLVDRASGSYVEVTPSKRGLRILGTGRGSSVHTVRQQDGGKFELYRDTARYIVVTGDQIGKCRKLPNIDRLIDDLSADAVGKDKSSSARFHKAVCDLADRGKTVNQIERLLLTSRYRETKAAQFDEEGRLRKEVERSLEKRNSTAPLEDDDEEPERALSDYKEEKIDWLWYPYIPLSMVTIIEGEGDIGKSRLTRYIGATITKGSKLEGQDTAHRPANVIIASFSEDPVPPVVLPQIRKMGGVLDKVFIIERPFTLDESGIALLSDAMERRKPRLVILDPLADYIPSKTNSYKDEEVRRYVMGPLQSLAQKHHCAILAIRHFRKSSDGPTKYRGGGSVAFTNVSRSTIACVEDSADPSVTVIGVSKGNLVPRSKKISRMFKIVETVDGIGALEWHGETQRTVEDVEQQRQHNARNPEREHEAREFLEKELKKGRWVKVQTLKSKCETYSCSWSTVERVKRMMDNVKSRGGHRGAPAEWCINNDDVH